MEIESLLPSKENEDIDCNIHPLGEKIFY